jgi:asparagine synthase (glutamine-hydrolysing)
VDEAALVAELEALLEDAVGRQLVADVPVGVLLSGGVDSSLVTAMAVRRCRKVHTFSIGFPGHGALDETPHARLIARHFGTEHVELNAEPATAELIPRLARQFDEPMADSSMIPTWLVSHLVRQHCTVALGGDGGDELFAGYPMHQRLMWLQRNAEPVPLTLRKAIAHAADRYLPVGMKGRNYLLSLGYDYRAQIPHFQEFFGPRLRGQLLPQFADLLGTAEAVRASRFPATRDLLQRATRFDFENYLAEDILVKVDRASMLNSLEVRAPLLDYRVIEFAFARIPSTLKASVSDKKILLKRLAERVLPSDFDRGRKQGFSIPLSEWLKAGPFRQLFWDTLLAADCLFDRATIQNLLRGQDRGFNNGERLFALVQFELWRREYKTIL